MLVQCAALSASLQRFRRASGGLSADKDSLYAVVVVRVANAVLRHQSYFSGVNNTDCVVLAESLVFWRGYVSDDQFAKFRCFGVVRNTVQCLSDGAGRPNDSEEPCGADGPG